MTTGPREWRRGDFFNTLPADYWARNLYSGGWATVLLGVVLHFTIAIGAAAVFYAGCQMLPALAKQPWITGPAYGLVVYSVMHCIVVPMSAVAHRETPMSGMELAD